MARDPRALPEHVRRAWQSSGADARFLSPSWRGPAAPGDRRAVPARQRDHRDGPAAALVHDAVRTLLGLSGERSGAAFRGVLLPGYRVLPDARPDDVRTRRTRRAQARARIPADENAVFPLPGRPTLPCRGTR